MKLSIQWKTHPNVPDSVAFQPYLLILANAALAAIKDPAEAGRVCEDAYQRVTAHLPRRPKEEIDLSRGKKWNDFARLRFKFARTNLKALRREVYPLVSSPQPLGPALLTIVRTIDLVLKELDRAYAAAPPLADEKQQHASAALPEFEVEVPDAGPGDGDEVRGDVTYDEILDGN